MKSGRQRRQEIISRRRGRPARMSSSEGELRNAKSIPRGAVAADLEQLRHDNSYDRRPLFYVDVSFTCIDCRKSEVWTAAQQKWWYEEAKGKIASRANRCRACRRKRRLQRSLQRRVHIEGLVAKLGIEGAALRLGVSVDALSRLRAREEKT